MSDVITTQDRKPQGAQCVQLRFWHLNQAIKTPRKNVAHASTLLKSVLRT